MIKTPALSKLFKSSLKLHQRIFQEWSYRLKRRFKNHGKILQLDCSWGLPVRVETRQNIANVNNFLSSFSAFSASVLCSSALLHPLLVSAQPAAPASAPASAPSSIPAAAQIITIPPGQPPQLSPALAPQPPPPLPLFDPKMELKGAALIAALQHGGYVLYMRHAISTVGTDGSFTTIANWWANCAIQRNIADSGRLQARKVGAALRGLKIPINEIKTSQFCRTSDTAHEMGLGPIEIVEDLNHAVGQRLGLDVNVARLALLSRKPDAGTNVLLVSHTHGSPSTAERAMGAIQEAEILVYLPNDRGGTDPIGRVLITEWDALLEGAKKAPTALTAPTG